MANKNLFKSVTDLVTNRAGGAAYALRPEAELAQYAVTGTFNGVFYADAGEDFARVKTLAQSVPAEFLARCAVFATKRDACATCRRSWWRYCSTAMRRCSTRRSIA